MGIYAFELFKFYNVDLLDYEGTEKVFKEKGADAVKLNTYKNQRIRKVNSTIEVINDENNEPSYIIETRPSKLLNGVFETTKYTLSNYPEDMDILKAIQNGTITAPLQITV